MKKGEMKQYLKDHKKEIALAVGGTLLLGAGVLVGWQGCKKLKFGKGIHVYNEDIAKYLGDAKLVYPDKISTLCAKYDDICITELGKLSERIELDDIWTADHKFTHFICIGAPIEAKE